MRNSFGTYYKRGQSYLVRWTENGTRKSKTVKSAKDAQELLARKRLEVGNVDTSIKFRDYYSAVVRPSMKRLSKRTRADYDNTWTRIKPIIGDVAIADANRRVVQNCIDKQSSPSAQRHAMVLIRKICNLAIADDIIIKNPVTRHIQRDRETKREKHIYSTGELIGVLNTIQDTEFALPVMLMCCTGLRPEECFALQKKHFDFFSEGGLEGYAYISIFKALTLVNGTKVLKEPKTASSKRIVCLYGDLVDYLTYHKQYMTNKRTLAEYPDGNALIKRWRRFCRNNKLEYVPFGTMRSVYATLSAEAGCLDSTVSQAMGHSGHTMKERNYQSLTLKMMRMNAECFANYLGYEWKDEDDGREKKL